MEWKLTDNKSGNAKNGNCTQPIKNLMTSYTNISKNAIKIISNSWEMDKYWYKIKRII